MKSRRIFLTKGLALGIGLPVAGNLGRLSHLGHFASPAKHPLKILLLGGTSFLGPHQIAYALGRGHAISIFTRGKTKPTIHRELFAHVEHLVGDRADDLTALENRKWDAVIDNSGHNVEWNRSSATLLRDNVETYLFTSSTGVYYPYLGSDIRENSELVLELPEVMTEDEKLEYGYGVMKANSEIVTKEIFGKDRTIVVRPTYMMGPGDTTDRFTYWPERLSKGGQVLVPGKADDPVQFIDARDVAGFMIRLLEQKAIGTYNAVGPASRTGMMAFIHGAHASFSSKADFVVVDDYDFLLENGIPYSVPWIMPTGKNFGSARANIDHGVNSGLTFRPLSKSLRDIYDWWHSDVVSEESRQKLSSSPKSLMAREAGILTAWKNR